MHEASATIRNGTADVPRLDEVIYDVHCEGALVMHPALSILTSDADVGAAHRGCAGWW
jgi:hypothetical protein